MLKKIIVIFIFSYIIISAQQPYVILVSFDGFRWDYLNRNITPNLENIRKTGVSASSLRPTFPSKTFPNHISIITGMYNDHHGIISNYFKNPFTNEVYKLGNNTAVKDPKWYRGEAFWETAKRQGIKTASFFWPGSEVTDVNRRPDYYKAYEHKKPYKERVDTVITWLKIPQEDRPHFLTLYFDAADTYGHDFGPNSKELNNAVKNLDNIVGYLYKGLEKIGMADSVNVIFVSDHGMTDISKDRIIRIDKILTNYKTEMIADGPFMLVKADKDKNNEIFNELKANEFHYKVYMKKDLPEYYHYKDDPFIPDIILIADLGWSLANERSMKAMKKHYSLGNHGYDNNQLDMHGIFLAKGPNFKNNYKTGTIWNIDIYPLLCKIFKVYPYNGVDGKLERIEFLLK